MIKREERPLGLNIGSASIIMIFAILCLTVFSALSLVTSVSEKKTAQRFADETAAYYEADSEAVKNKKQHTGGDRCRKHAAAGRRGQQRPIPDRTGRRGVSTPNRPRHSRRLANNFRPRHSRRLANNFRPRHSRRLPKHPTGRHNNIQRPPVRQHKQDNRSPYIQQQNKHPGNTFLGKEQHKRMVA